MEENLFYYTVNLNKVSDHLFVKLILFDSDEKHITFIQTKKIEMLKGGMDIQTDEQTDEQH